MSQPLYEASMDKIKIKAMLDTLKKKRKKLSSYYINGHIITSNTAINTKL